MPTGDWDVVDPQNTLFGKPFVIVDRPAPSWTIGMWTVDEAAPESSTTITTTTTTAGTWTTDDNGTAGNTTGWIPTSGWKKAGVWWPQPADNTSTSTGGWFEFSEIDDEDPPPAPRKAAPPPPPTMPEEGPRKFLL